MSGLVGTVGMPWVLTTPVQHPRSHLYRMRERGKSKSCKTATLLQPWRLQIWTAQVTPIAWRLGAQGTQQLHVQTVAPRIRVAAQKNMHLPLALHPHSVAFAGEVQPKPRRPALVWLYRMQRLSKGLQRRERQRSCLAGIAVAKSGRQHFPNVRSSGGKLLPHTREPLRFH